MLVRFGNAGIAPLFAHCYGQLEDGHASRGPAVEYCIRRERDGFAIEASGREPLRAEDEDALLFEFESDLAVALQLLRPDLLFLHSGAVATRDGAVLLVGDSGAGKSTLTWSLLRRGFLYMSDELAPVGLESMCVHAYPRAISLKDLPPPPFQLPPGTLRTTRGYRVPVGEIGNAGPTTARPIHTIFFLERGAAEAGTPRPRPLGNAEAAARLLTNALNPSAHRAHGLDAALAIASSASCFELCRAPLGVTCDLVEATLG